MADAIEATYPEALQPPPAGGRHNGWRRAANPLDGALARSFLMVIIAEQVALDSGDWLVAQQLAFEPAPPFPPVCTPALLTPGLVASLRSCGRSR